MGVLVESSGLPLEKVGENKPGLCAGVFPVVLAPVGIVKSRDCREDIEEKEEF